MINTFDCISSVEFINDIKKKQGEIQCVIE